MVRKILVSIATVSILVTSNALACNISNCMKTCATKRVDGHSTINQVVKAVSKTGLSASQTKKIADGIGEYKKTIVKVNNMKVFPIDSFIDDEFNERRFIKEMSEKYIARVAAKAALFKYVFLVLDKDQKKTFKKEYAAPLIEEIIKRY